MMFKSKDIGKLGENLALQYLKKARFSILEKNFHSHWGEIDIIAKKDNKVFLNIAMPSFPPVYQYLCF